MPTTTVPPPVRPPSAAAPTLHRLAVAHATAFSRRARRQNVAVLVVASLLGLGPGTAAPNVSPAAPPPAAASGPDPAQADQAPADQAPADQAPADRAPVGRVGPFGRGGGRR